MDQSSSSSSSSSSLSLPGVLAITFFSLSLSLSSSLQIATVEKPVCSPSNQDIGLDPTKAVYLLIANTATPLPSAAVFVGSPRDDQEGGGVPGFGP